MPTYIYKCKKCGKKFEKEQSMMDNLLTKCQDVNPSKNCTGDIFRVINKVGIQFKGSGWYVTDSKTKSKSNSSDKSKKSTASDKSKKPTSSNKDVKKNKKES